LREERHHHALDQLRHRANAEEPGLTGLEGARSLAERLGVTKQASAVLEQVFAGGRQLKAAPDQIEQPHAQFRFERMELSGNGGLTEVDPSGRPAQSASIGDGDKGLQVAQVHSL
jgi:hypothetical protein